MAKQEKNEDLEETKSILQKQINEIKNNTELPKDSFQEKWKLFEGTVKVIVGASTSCPKSKVFIELMLNEFKEKLEESNQQSRRRQRRRRIQDDALNSDSEDDEKDAWKDYDVKKVVGKIEDDDGKVKYRIVWENTWEPKDQLNCDEKIAAYEENPNKTDVRKIKGKDVDKDGNVLYKIEWEDTWEPNSQLRYMEGCTGKIKSYEDSQKRKSEQKNSNDDGIPSKRSKHSSSPHGRRSPKISSSTPSHQRSNNSSHHRSSSSSRPSSTSGRKNQESNSSFSHRSSSSSRTSSSGRQNQESNSSSHKSSSSSRPSNAQNQDSRSYTAHQYSSSRSSNSSTQNQDSRNHTSHQNSSSGPSTSKNDESWGHTYWDRNNENPCPKSFKFKFIPYHSSSFQNKGSGNYLCTLNMEITAQILDIFKKEKRLWPTNFKLFPTKDCSRNFKLITKTVRFKPSQYDHQIRRKEPETLVEIEFTHV